ncbi:MAG: hypothetical protein KU28_05345 [Sulfurovum sp. PC08-66]|nr:MAG: hypothetical protein KU28_05345 [Sulfurovum sp. PC08-66]
MQMVKKILIAFVVIWFGIVTLAPKERLFFLIEEELALSDTVISHETLNAKLFGIEAKGASLSVKGVEVATIGELDISTLLLFSSVDVSRVVLDASSRSIVPLDEFNLSVTHSLFAPKGLGIKLSYQDKVLHAKLTMTQEGRVRIDIADINGSEWLKPMMQQDENGWYYENAI